MIVPMLKYSFLIYHKDSKGFMDDLMEMGLVHIIDKEVPVKEEVNALTKRIKDGETVLKSLEQRGIKELLSVQDVEGMEGIPTIEDFFALEKELEQVNHSIEVYHSDIKQLEPWGDIPWERMRKLEKEAGLTMRFFEYPKRKFESDWLQEHAIEIINEKDGRYYFVLFHMEEYKALPLVPLVLPKKSLEQVKTELQEKQQRAEEISATLDNYAKNFINLLKDRLVALKDELAFKMAETQAENLAEETLILLEAWCPQIKTETLEGYLNKHHTVFVKQEPEEGEKPPVLLKNNKFSKLFEPIGNLFSLPDYSELDLTVYFAPFFLLFFGFCLGDMGYGLVILVATTLLKSRVGESTKGFMTLGQLFGISTTVIGFFSGTLFGIEMLKENYFAPVHGFMLNQDQMFYVALGVGFVQIIFGMCVQVYKQVKFLGWVHALNRIGWIIGLLAGLVYLGAEEMKMPQFMMPSLVFVIIGAVLVVFFGSPKDGWLKSFGLGLADLYNITGVAGDLLSYIRLFALGVSSAILGLVVNDIAMSAGNIPYVGIVLTILILIIGHTANLMLASLSAFVHPMRLTFVEFYKNVGFLGGGKPFKLFEKKYQSKKESE